MNWLRTIAQEIFGLFVDDGSFAFAILVWLAAIWFLSRELKLPVAGGVVLFLGLAAILFESVTRFTRKSNRSR
jgi:hypothetical protein